MEFILPNFLFRRIIFQLLSRSLTASSCFQWRLFQQKLLQVVCGVEVSLFTRWFENRLDLFLLKEFKVYALEENTFCESVEPGGTNSISFVLLQEGANGVYTGH